MSSACSTESRISPAVSEPILSRASQAASIVRSRLADAVVMLVSRHSLRSARTLVTAPAMSTRSWQRLDEAGKVVGDEVDVRSVAALDLPILGQHFARS